MTANLQQIFETLDALSPEELEQVRQHLQDLPRRAQPAPTDPEEAMAAFRAAVEKFREGLSEAELQVLMDAMNVEYHQSMKDLAAYDWLDELPEGER